MTPLEGFVLHEMPALIEARCRALNEAARRAYRHRNAAADDMTRDAFQYAGDVYYARALAITAEWTDE